MKKTLLLALAILILIALPLAAASRYHLGISFVYDVDTLSGRILDEAFRNEDLPESIYNGGAISQLHALGPRFDISIFPFGSNIPIGFGISSTTLLNVGYTKTSGVVESYFSRHQDLRQDLTAGIYFQKAYGTTWGLFAAAGLSFSWYRYADKNMQNDKTGHDYIRFTSWGISADLGAYLEYGNTFFKVGATLHYNLQDLDSISFRYGLVAGGGVYLE